MPENLQQLSKRIQIDEDVWRGSEVRSMPKITKCWHRYSTQRRKGSIKTVWKIRKRLKFKKKSSVAFDFSSLEGGSMSKITSAEAVFHSKYMQGEKVVATKIRKWLDSKKMSSVVFDFQPTTRLKHAEKVECLKPLLQNRKWRKHQGGMSHK